ncbi:hypothetical protein [Mesorhizobium sp. CA5]|uniref:hypothetical protein n=1 Tax=unclassified Mesorhizobium TaxID=325217 RepID=UPI00398CECF0
MALWVKFADCHQTTRSRTVSVPIEFSDSNVSQPISWGRCFPVQKAIRLLGVRLSSLVDVLPPEQRQLRFEL